MPSQAHRRAGRPTTCRPAHPSRDWAAPGKYGDLPLAGLLAQLSSLPPVEYGRLEGIGDEGVVVLGIHYWSDSRVEVTPVEASWFDRDALPEPWHPPA